MPSRNIIIAPCGNKASIFKEYWLRYKEEREFELCLLFYHEQVNNPALYADVDHFFHLKGFKYHMIHRLLTEVRPEWLQQYDHFYFLDDDIEIDTRQINQMFALSKAFGAYISCAALTRDSFCSWPFFKQEANSWCRFVGQIEVMAPLFSREALQKCLETFVANRSSWGMDSVWPKILGYPQDKFVVFDKVVMRHTQPVGKGELYQKIGVDPYDEWAEIVARYGAKRQNYTEYGRLLPVNNSNNRLYRWWYRGKEFLNKRRQSWNDYDLPSRVKSRLSKISGQ
ncbi:MAG TPA: hypothetical protein VHC48_09000 [Puia sp.]|nr:hypothetical protein [Puia sp.]